MKKVIIASFLISLVVLIGVSKDNIVKAATQLLRSGATTPSYQTSNATTSPNYLSYGFGTTTLTFSSSDLSSITIMENVFASTSAVKASLNMEVQGSDDNIDWFTQDPTTLNPITITTGASYVASSTIQLASSTLPYIYFPSVRNSTTTKMFRVPLVPARYTKLIFYVASTTWGRGTSDAMDLWVNVTGITNVF